MKIRILLAYDGTAFRGWQSQPGGRTVQDALEDAVCGIIGERLTVHGSGRTDAGVHALAQTAHFELSPAHCLRLGRMKSPERWVGALNATLPNELRVMKATRAAKDFHSRFSASGKIYRYDLWHAPILPPHLLKRVWHLPGGLDRSVIHELSGKVEGRHDFRGFCANSGSLPDDTHRTLHRVTVRERGSAISITLKGEGFLYRMARMIVGGMVRVARGRDDTASYCRRLHGGKPWPAPVTAPAEGLYLVKVLYSKGEKSR